MREFKISGFLSLIFFASYCFTYTFSLQPDLSDPNRGLPHDEKVSHRSERDDDIKRDVALKVNNLNDTHQQLIIHWVGEGSPIIICLARDSKEVSRRTKVPSAVYYSYDYGETFENKTDLFKMPNGTFVQFDKFYIHTKFPSQTIFTDSTNKMIFITEDYGRSFRSHSLTFVPNEVSILPSSLKIFLIHDKTDSNKKLYITQDFGYTWTLLQEYVRSYEWFSEDNSDRKQLIVQREGHNSTTIIKLKSSTWLFSKIQTEVLMNSVAEMTVKGDYIFAVKNNSDNGSISSPNKDLFIKYKNGPFTKASFASVLVRKDFFIADITENRVMVVVNHALTLANLYVSDIITERTTEINFSLSLERIFCYFPNSTWKSSLISNVADSVFVDLHKVEGLRGIYIASYVLPTNTSAITPEHLASRITFNWGVTWRPLNLTDKQASESNCVPAEECSLHLSQKFTLLYPGIRQNPILSSKSAPGLIIATGVYGKQMKGVPSVYMSRDGGVTFKQVLKENMYFNMGDHGGIIVAVKTSLKQRDNTSYLVYSTDMGDNWQYIKLNDTPLKVYSLMTEPGENTTVFSLFASPPGNEHHWIIIKADFQKVFSYNCTEDDFKTWTPYNPDEQKMNCVLGRREVYRRRRPNSKCYTGIINYHPIEADICPCDRTDYMCDEGFYWEAVTEHCIRNKTLPDAHYAVPKNCPPLTYFQRTKGYKKIPGDVCEGGLREYEYDQIPCPLREHRDFLLLAQKDRIVRIPLETSKLEVLPLQSLQNVIAIEYDMRSKCLYYADIVTDVISKWCMDSASLPKTVVDSHLHSVEGMAFDWISQHLYFVDGVSAKIEVVRVDVDNSNRYRRTIINSTIGRKPRGIAVHPIAGYMFWTDWISGAPSIYRACLDGSNPTVLFTKPIVEWPNGITVDFIADRIYWVDAKGDYIASSDFFGKGFKKVIEHDSRVSHPFSVAIFKDNMYWDDWRANAIFVADKDHGLGQEMVASNLPGLMDLKIYAHSIQEGVNGCMNNTCSHMCFGLPNNQSTCACPDDLVLVDGRKCVCPGGAEPKNGACSLVQNTCAPDRFRCTDGKCLPITNRCDGDADCSDGSDELECGNTTTTCEPNSFRCGTGKCIAASWRCDHDLDCPDRSDEKDCVYPVCKAGQFMCDNGRCISNKWHCDFENDCRDGSDERNCTINPMSQCMLPDEHKCPGGRNSPCIPSSWICDNEPDCPDGSDEKNCTLNQCEENRFQCTTTKKCIFWMWKCDGEDDCDDNSDEMNCPTPTNRTILPFVPSPPPSFSCDSAHATFQCKDKTCIPLAWKCDRVSDCDDGSDEIGCGFNIPIEPKEKSSNKTTDYVCKFLDFTCSSGECIPRAYVCDREVDCKDGSDEKYCNGVIGCKTDGSQFRCRRTGTCIDSHLICDGHKDCMDGSDEGVCDSSTSNTTVAACPHGFFRCDQFRCEPLYKKCDGSQKDCVDESDEQYCTARDRTYQATQLVVEKTFDEAVLFTWRVKPGIISSLEYLPSISRADSTDWTNTSWIDFTFYRFDELEPYSTYNVTVYVRDTATNKTFPPAFYLKFTSGRGVPSPPRDVNAKISSILSNYAQIEVTWSPPIKPNGEIRQYFVYVEPPHPAMTVIVPGNSRRVVLNMTLVNSIVEYKITVTAKNELFVSAYSAAFTITVTDRGLKKVADLRADSPTDYSMTLKWRPQKPNLNYTIDVSTSYSQLNVYPPYESHTTKETQFTVSGLSPGVRYVFLVYAVDGNAVSEGARVQGSTIGTELPLVSNLSVATDDTKSKNVILNWSPVKDDKGKEKYAYGVYYGVSKTDLYTGAKNITNSTNIRLYDLAACTSYLFDVGVVLLSSPYAIPGPLGHPAHFLTDIDVRAPPTLVRILPTVSTSEPNITILWSASCHVVNRPVAYVIRIVEVNTKEANEINVDPSTDLNFKRTFTAKFGSVYNISVATSTQRTKEEWMQFETRRIPPPAGLFVNYMIRNSAMVFWTIDSLDVSLQNTNYSYEIQVCEGDKMDVDAAKTYNTSSRSIEIKDLNWRAGQSYAFAVRVVMPDGRRSDWSRVFVKTIPMINEVEAPSAKKEEEQEGEGVTSSFMWFSIIFVALVGGAAGFLYWKRKRSHINSFKNLANSHYNTRSGSTTFSGVNGLDLDDTPEIREHFSDDEPLVIA